MTTYFKMIGQINSRADYDKILRKALDKPGQEPFHYLDAYPFDKKEAPLVLLGDVAKTLIGDLKKVAPKAQYAMGVCTVADNGDILFEREVGKLQPRLVSAALKLSGFKGAIKFSGEEDGSESENEGDGGQKAEQPKTTAPVGKTPPVGNKAPVPNTTAKAPVTAPSSQVPPRAKEWQDKVKILKPVFDMALKKARTQTKGTWAEDLDSNFSQMLQEAKAGDFDKAMNSLARLARMVKSEEAARAEVKHQNKKEDEFYAEGMSERLDKNYSKQEVKEVRQANKAKGYGTTEDGNLLYALPVKPADWKSRVLGGLDKLDALLKKRPLDVYAVSELSNDIYERIGQVRTHAHESDGQFPERTKGIVAVEDAYSDYLEEFEKITATLSNTKSSEEFVQDCSELRALTVKHLGTPRQVPDPVALRQFEQQANQRASARQLDFRKRDTELKDLEKEVQRLVVAFRSLPQETDPDPHKDEREELKRELDDKQRAIRTAQKLLDDDRRNHDNGVTEREEFQQFKNGERQPDKLMAMLKQLDRTKALLEHEQVSLALEVIKDLSTNLSSRQFAQEDPKEQEIYQLLGGLETLLSIATQAKSASPVKAARLAKRVKVEAAAFEKLLS